MKILSQHDLLWASRKLGSSNMTVGRYGCTTTCISMLSDYFGSYKSPVELASNTNNYTSNGLIIWKNLKFDKMKFDRRSYLQDNTGIHQALIDPNKAVMLEVNDSQHWVVALRPTWFSNSYWVADPWSGDKCNVIRRYKNITGAAFFSRK